MKRAALLVVVLAAALLAGAAARADTFTVVPTPLVTSLAPDAAATQAPLPYAELLSLWQQAGAQYGVPWQVLAAINKIESNFGRNMGPSSAGAIGWMQFMPSTWMRWGVDANGDGIADPWNASDAIFSAARYLAAAGAPADLYRAVFAYNHADWYVREVLSLADLYQTDGSVAFSLDRMQQNLDAARKAVVAAATRLRAAQTRESRATLLSDRLTERANVLHDESVIVAELRKMVLDRNNPTALAGDKQVLPSDRIKLQTDMTAGLDKRIADRQAAFNTIFNDVQTIITAVNNDPNASAQLKADVGQWGADRTARMTTLTADLQKIEADRTQLVADLTALQSA